MTKIRYHKPQDNTLKFANLQRSRRDCSRPDYFTLDAKKGVTGVVAKVLWRLLHKMHALRPHFETIDVWHYGPEEQKSVTEAILSGVDQMLRSGRGEPDDWCIVLGGQEFHELTSAMWAEGREMHAFPSGRIQYGRNGINHEFRGLPVHVVPWLSGVAVLPKVIVEREGGEAARATQAPSEGGKG